MKICSHSLELMCYVFCRGSLGGEVVKIPIVDATEAKRDATSQR